MRRFIRCKRSHVRLIESDDVRLHFRRHIIKTRRTPLLELNKVNLVIGLQTFAHDGFCRQRIVCAQQREREAMQFVGERIVVLTVSNQLGNTAFKLRIFFA
jgi:hypothetical protein